MKKINKITKTHFSEYPIVIAMSLKYTSQNDPINNKSSSLVICTYFLSKKKIVINDVFGYSNRLLKFNISRSNLVKTVNLNK